DRDTLIFVIVKTLGADGFNFRDDKVGIVLGDNRIKGCAVEHVDDFKTVGNLHRWRIFVAVYRDDGLADALGGNGEFLAEFSGAEKEYFFVHSFGSLMLKRSLALAIEALL